MTSILPMPSAAPPKPLDLILADEAQRECANAQRALSDATNRHKGVHEARKAIRRLRSLLRLVEAALGPSIDAIDSRLRKLARGLSALRDAHVVVNTAELAAGEPPAPPWHELLPPLRARQERHLAQVLAKDPRFHRRRSELRALAARLSALKWPEVSPDAIERGLLRSERRVRPAQTDVEAKPTVKNLHRWRRRVRRLRMQLELIRRIRNKGQSLTFTRQHRSAIRALSARSDAIGAIQDLRTLRRVIGNEIDVEVGRQVKKALQALEAPHHDVLRSPQASDGSDTGAIRSHSN